jgi:hypothetical protein
MNEPTQSTHEDDLALLNRIILDQSHTIIELYTDIDQLQDHIRTLDDTIKAYQQALDDE